MDYSHYETDCNLKIEIEDKVASLTLNRPDKRNAIDFKLKDGLERAFRELSYDNGVGAIESVMENMARRLTAQRDSTQ